MQSKNLHGLCEIQRSQQAEVSTLEKCIPKGFQTEGGGAWAAEGLTRVRQEGVLGLLEVGLGSSAGTRHGISKAGGAFQKLGIGGQDSQEMG